MRRLSSPLNAAELLEFFLKQGKDEAVHMAALRAAENKERGDHRSTEVGHQFVFDW